MRTVGYFLPIVKILSVACSNGLFLTKYLAIAFGKMKLSFIMLEHEGAKPNHTG